MKFEIVEALCQEEFKNNSISYLEQLCCNEYKHETEQERMIYCKSYEKNIKQHCQITKESDYTYLHSSFGESSSSNVIFAYENTLNLFIVIKEIIHDNGPWMIPLHCVYELNAHKRLFNLNSKHIQQLLNVQIKENSTKLITKLIPISFSMLFRRPLLQDFTVAKCKELMSIVHLLHKNNICHRDIKSSNICFDEHSNLVLIDFDSTALDQIHERRTLPVCTIITRAPELFLLESKEEKEYVSYDARTLDWWSVGCVIAEMFLTEPLFIMKFNDDYKKIHDKLKDMSLKLQSMEGHPQLKRVMPTKFYNILKDLLHLDPKQRFHGYEQLLEE